MIPMLSVSRIAARRFLIRAFALDGFQTMPDAASVLDTLGFIQEDSINVCGRIHDLILWSRVQDYTPADLARLLYGDTPRRAWEFYLPNLCVLPTTDFPYFLPNMLRQREKESRWGKLTQEEEAAAITLFSRLDSEGPLFLRDTTEHTEHGHTTGGWGTRTRMLSFVADKLFWQGRLGIAKRDGFLRAFDRLERLLPAEVLNAPIPTDEEANAHLLRRKLRARRLFRLRAADKALLAEGEIIPLKIETDSRTWYVFADDLEALTTAESSTISETVHFLAPLDPLIYDRDRNRLLWDFDYTWEVYVPAAKRKWGYYVLPILFGDRLIGRIEPRFNKKTRELQVISLNMEANVDDIAQPLAERLRTFAQFANVSQIGIDNCESKLRQDLLTLTA